jgi:queuine tRNA-ribosyltransferase
VSFTVTATDGEARAGVLRTAHGDVPTPAFMPVGTKATVKGLDPVRLRELGTTILLGNTYHLHFRPGEATIAELGGLHRFMGWTGRSSPTRRVPGLRPRHGHLGGRRRGHVPLRPRR